MLPLGSLAEGENGYCIEGPLRGPTGQPQTVNGKGIMIRFDVDFSGVPCSKLGIYRPSAARRLWSTGLSVLTLRGAL